MSVFDSELLQAELSLMSSCGLGIDAMRCAVGCASDNFSMISVLVLLADCSWESLGTPGAGWLLAVQAPYQRSCLPQSGSIQYVIWIAFWRRCTA